MKPVPFDQQNCTYRAEDCYDLPAFRHLEEFGNKQYPAITSVWELDEDEIDMIIASRKVAFTIISNDQPPIRLEVVNEVYPE